ncbi:eCIS core domain-containing protein [Paludibacterium paludis]|uniref:eCIS core domain-containing protein n=1 Tax=Paludibacterium paludis TaxID=1225769 RepID=A0A918P1N2_9NEIS|nr:DUF4157 domain-containing protein [Paludibacterium paludis]GGY13908.1 hypothetical protein GCM10011289_16580 [Paludibacterium paludis]
MKAREHAPRTSTDTHDAPRQPKGALQRQVDESPRQLAQGERLAQLQADTHPNGLPAQLRHGIENLSGLDMGDVRVHRNSDKPAQLNAHAYAQGSDIYLGPGQDKHLPHEAWHVVQQKQGRVRPTVQMQANILLNDENKLEKEANVAGEKALQPINMDTSKKEIYQFHNKNIIQMSNKKEETGKKRNNKEVDNKTKTPNKKIKKTLTKRKMT